MTGPEPKSADLIVTEPTTVLPWEQALADTRLYWLATVHPTGRPHVRPVLAVWVDGALCSTSTMASRKGRNLAADPRCTVTARTENMDVVLEGNATQVTSERLLTPRASAADRTGPGCCCPRSG